MPGTVSQFATGPEAASRTCDVLIGGGRPAGSIAAIPLPKRHYRVVVSATTRING